MLARSVRRMSIRCPRRLAASRRVRRKVERQRQPRDRLLGLGDLGCRHLREILFLQHLAVGHRQSRVDLDFGLVLALVEAAEQRLLNALRARRRRLGRSRRRARQHGGDQLLDIAALAEENAEGLVEQQRVLVSLHEHRVQRPVEILAVADMRNVKRLQRVKHRARPDGEARRAQRAREVEDVFRKAALGLTLGHASYSAALKSAFASSSSALTLLPSRRAMSS